MNFNYKIKITYINGNTMENRGTEFATKNSYDLAVKFATERDIATVARYYMNRPLETYAA
jgi:hypothetical protein